MNHYKLTWIEISFFLAVESINLKWQITAVLNISLVGARCQTVLPSSSFSRAKEVGKKVLAIRCPPFRKSNYISLYSQEPGRLELWCWCQSKIKANGFLSIFQSRAGTQVGKGLQSQNGFKFTLNCWHHSLEIHRIVVTERPISPFLCFLKWT